MLELEFVKSRENLETWNIIEDGTAIAEITVALTAIPPIGTQEFDPSLHILGIRAPGGPNSLGPQKIRQVFNLLKEEYPEAKTIQGERVTGTRARLKGAARQSITRTF